MLKLDLAEVARGGAQVHAQVTPDDALWQDSGIRLLEPLDVDLDARPVGDGVLVRGRIRTSVQLECRRCLATVERELDESLELLFEPLEGADAEELQGEVFALPERGTVLDLREPFREQLLLSVPAHVVCREECRGLCPQCGTDLNETECSCVPEPEPGPWDALKTIRFD